jgi:glycosyltransferase involved in cell wall biosynthesis
VKRVCVLTDFLNYDPGYSLCHVVRNQVKMLVRNGYKPRLIVRKGFQDKHKADYPGAEVVAVDPGETGDNRVTVTTDSPADIERLHDQLRIALDGHDVCLTHDLIYQPNMWKHHVAARRLALERPELRWLHWVHSATDLGAARKTRQFRQELRGPFPHSRLVAMHPEEVQRKGNLFGYEQDQIVVIPNPIDLTAGFDPLALAVVDELDLMTADVVAVYPCRLDRGKQPHIIIEVFAQLRDLGYDARVVIVDFHSTAGDKATYRDEMKAQAEKSGVPVLFTSDVEGGWGGAPYSYCVPNRAVRDLFAVADVLVHPSMSECDPLILPEAAWARCALVLNFDLPVFRQYDGRALLYKFSSAIDVHTGMPGNTNVKYGSREEYMREVAGGIAYLMENNPVLYLHAKMRKERSLEGAWHKLWAAIEGQWD